jgi:hypothetical protein
MSVYSTEYHAMVSSPSAAPENVAVSAERTGNQDEGFFHHLLDVVNPLQHLPVISTVYRAVTGEHIGPVEKIAGDALYGGLWGAISSVAEVAFEGITGKSPEDTVIGWFKGDNSSQLAKITAPAISVAQSLPSSDTPPLPASSTTVASAPSNGSDVMALSAALTARGVTGDMASRALDAYRRSLIVPASAPVLAIAN